MIAHQGQEATTPSPHKDSTAAYQHFARLLMQVGDGDAAVKEAEEIWVLLHKIIQECSRAHVEAGKSWICKHCTDPVQLEALVDLMVALVSSTPSFDDKLHIIYLVNDLLAYSDRKNVEWIKQTLYPKLVSLLRLAYHCPRCDQNDQNKVLKVIGIWRQKEYFPLASISAIQNAVTMTMNAAADRHSQPPELVAAAAERGDPHILNKSISNEHAVEQPTTHTTPHALPQIHQTHHLPLPDMPKKSYHELPAGPMLSLAKFEYNPYTPIQSTQLALAQRQPPSQELLTAINEYYQGLSFSSEGQFDSEGWENGYLDAYLGDMANRKAKAAEIQAQRKKVEESRSSRRGRSDSPDGTDGRHRARSRSRSRGRRRSSSRSRHRSRRSISRSRSPSRGRRPRSRSPPRRARSPASRASANDWGPPRQGLGADAPSQPSGGDVFDTYRRNRSYTNNNRETPRRSEGVACYKCYKFGHLARECTS